MVGVVDKLRAMVSKPKDRKSMFAYARSDIVTILAGPDKVPFKIHKDLLCDNSEYFAANFSDTWNEDKKAEASVLEVEGEIFQMIFGWLYTSELPYDVERPESTEERTSPNWVTMIRLYRAADFLMISALMNKIADTVLMQHREKNQAWNLKGFLSFLPYDIMDVPLFYKLILDSAVSWMTEFKPDEEELRNDLAEIQEQCPQAMTDIIIRMNTYHGQFKPIASQDWCIYHVHPEGQKCSSWNSTGPSDTTGTRQANWPLQNQAS